MDVIQKNYSEFRVILDKYTKPTRDEIKHRREAEQQRVRNENLTALQIALPPLLYDIAKNEAEREEVNLSDASPTTKQDALEFLQKQLEAYEQQLQELRTIDPEQFDELRSELESSMVAA